MGLRPLMCFAKPHGNYTTVLKRIIGCSGVKDKPFGGPVAAQFEILGFSLYGVEVGAILFVRVWNSTENCMQRSSFNFVVVGD